MAATRAVVEHEIDWPCQIERLYSDVNLGCRLGVSHAITWFFDQVEEGIILEDDCVPHPDFFFYCSSLLERFRHDTRVWCISGNNFQDGQWRGDGSYYFSNYNHCWGWSSWRRCWHHYDSDLRQWPALRESGLLDTIFEDPLEHKYWSCVWQRLLESGEPDTWDYQWMFTCLVNRGLTALPNRNLVSNVGFGEDATHTTHVADPTLADQSLGRLRHPTFVLRNASADAYSFDHHFGGVEMRRSRKLIPRVKARLRHHWYQLQHVSR
ncbi:nucleotide-diphospho-sugar transferase [Synechococcus sp. RS9907]|nr:nucleotide-diphospho-sugar transferase [Synechococcus sp. RS9907]